MHISEGNVGGISLTVYRQAKPSEADRCKYMLGELSALRNGASTSLFPSVVNRGACCLNRIG